MSYAKARFLPQKLKFKCENGVFFLPITLSITFTVECDVKYNSINQPLLMVNGFWIFDRSYNQHETMCKVCTSEVKVTLGGQCQQWDSIFVSLHNVVIPWWILEVFCRNVNLNQTMCQKEQGWVCSWKTMKNVKVSHVQLHLLKLFSIVNT